MKIDIEVLKQAIKNAKEKVSHSIVGFKELKICESCVGGQYFWALDSKGRNELWEEKNVRGTRCACHTAWKLIDEAFKTCIYSDEKFKDACDFNNQVIGCIYPQYSVIEKLLAPRAVRI